MDNISLITQAAQQVKARVRLLSAELEQVGEFDGFIVSMNLTIDNASAVRRTMTLTVTTMNGAEALQSVEGVWVDKVVGVDYGVYDPENNDYTWFLLGTFVLSNSSYTFGVGEQQVELTLIDMMGLAMESRGSQIGYDMTIYEDSIIKEALKATIRDFTRLTNTDIVNFDDIVPYDIEMDKGIYPYDVLKKLVELYPYYEQFFSREGVYTVKLIPMTKYDPIVLTADDMKKLIISENGGGDYSEIANVAEVWGEEIDAEYTAKTCTTEGETYNLYISDTYEVLEDGMTVSFTADSDSAAGMKMKIQDTRELPIYHQKGDGTYFAVRAGDIKKDVAYAVKYVSGRFVLLGDLLIHAIAMEYNTMPSADEQEYYKTKWDCPDISFVVSKNSKFTVDTPGIDVVKRVFTGGDYSAIYSTQLALERARYELWLSCRLRNMKTLKCVFVPWLETNQKIEYTSIVDGVTRQYLVEKIVTNFDGTMTLSVSQFYPLYQWLDYTTWAQLSKNTWEDVKDTTWGDIDEFDN